MLVANAYCIAVALDVWDHAHTQYEFVMTLLLDEVPAPKAPTAATVLHLPDLRTGGQLKCAACGTNTAYICTTCNVALHPAKCFAEFHTAQPPVQEEEGNGEGEQDEEDDESEQGEASGEEVEETEDDDDDDLSDEEFVDESEVDE